MFPVSYRKFHIAFRIHYVDFGNSCKSMFGGRLHVVGHIATTSFIGSIALHYGAIDKMYKFFYHICTQMIGIPGLSRRNLYSHPSLGLSAEGRIDFN